MSAPPETELLELLHGLSEGIRRATLTALAEKAPTRGGLQHPVGVGVGDVTYEMDRRAEELISEFLFHHARSGPLSLLSEDAGWRHMGPGPDGEPVALEGFDHGGPRIAIDPIDGTRNLMAGMRPAWTVIAVAPAGSSQPRLSDVTHGIVSEIPVLGTANWRSLCAETGGECRIVERVTEGGGLIERRVLLADEDDRVDHGYYPFFRYVPSQRPAIAEVEAAFFARLAEVEGADLRHVFDDQYISSAGQMVLLSLGTYRMIADLRAHLLGAPGAPGASAAPVVTSKPYDIAGAAICARAAGCLLTAPDGSPLDFPLDAATPVSFVGYTNEATHRRLSPHLAVALGGAPSRPDSP